MQTCEQEPCFRVALLGTNEHIFHRESLRDPPPVDITIVSTAPIADFECNDCPPWSARQRNLTTHVPVEGPCSRNSLQAILKASSSASKFICADLTSFMAGFWSTTSFPFAKTLSESDSEVTATIWSCSLFAAVIGILPRLTAMDNKLVNSTRVKGYLAVRLRYPDIERR